MMKNRHTNERSTGFQRLGKKKRKNRAGTTLVEALIAMAVFAVFTTGSCKLLVAHRKLMDMARDHYTAANIAKNRYEMARTFDFEQLADLGEDALVVDASGMASDHGHFRRTTEITLLNTNAYELTITVNIQNRKTLAFDTAEQTITTYLSKKP